MNNAIRISSKAVFMQHTLNEYTDIIRTKQRYANSCIQTTFIVPFVMGSTVYHITAGYIIHVLLNCDIGRVW